MDRTFSKQIGDNLSQASEAVEGFLSENDIFYVKAVSPNAIYFILADGKIALTQTPEEIHYLNVTTSNEQASYALLDKLWALCAVLPAEPRGAIQWWIEEAIREDPNDLELQTMLEKYLKGEAPYVRTSKRF